MKMLVQEPEHTCHLLQRSDFRMLWHALGIVFARRASGQPSYNVSTKTYRSDLLCTTELYIIPIANPNVVATSSRIIRLIFLKMAGSYLFPHCTVGGITVLPARLQFRGRHPSKHSRRACFRMTPTRAKRRTKILKAWALWM